MKLLKGTDFIGMSLPILPWQSFTSYTILSGQKTTRRALTDLSNALSSKAVGGNCVAGFFCGE